MIPSVILNEDDLREAVDYIKKQDAFAFDLEAQGEFRNVAHKANVSWMSLASKGIAIAIPFGHPIGDRIIGERKVPHKYETGKKIGETYYKTVPVYEPPPEQLSRAAVFHITSELFSDERLVKIGHNMVYDLTASSQYLGFTPVGPYRDTKIEQWLLDETRIGESLKDDVEHRFGHKYDYENTGACVEKFPFSTVAYYSYCDSKYTYLLDKYAFDEVKREGLEKVCRLEMTLISAMVRMSLSGQRVDIDRLHELHDDLSKRVVVAEGEVYKAAGKRFNLNSPKQKQQILYGPKPEGQGLKPWRLTATAQKKVKLGAVPDITFYSTDDHALLSYPMNPVCNTLRDYGDIHKLLSTYVDSYLGTEDEPSIIYDEHIYAGFMQYGTKTGRFSCRKPNLQNIPRPHSELGKLIRGVFIPEEGGKLVVADYGQIELVVLAHYVGKGALYEGFMKGIDPHTMTAAMVLGKDPDDVSKVERQDLGKTLGFAVIYGAGMVKIASMAHLPDARAARTVLNKHAEMFPEIHGFKQQVIDLARSRHPVPYISTLLGRRRRIPELRSRDEFRRMGAERQMFNALIQGGAADLIKLAMIRVDEALPPEIQLTMTVHDEIVLACPEDRTGEAESILREAMLGEGIQKQVRVPLKADILTVDRWSDAK